MPFSPASGPLCVPSGATSQQISSNSQVAAPGDRRSDKRPRTKSRVRWCKSVLALAFLLFLRALGGLAPSAAAQTAHFSGGVSTVGNGFSFPYGVAVDGSGNVFVADDGNNAVKEILAAGGYTTVHTLSSGFSNPTIVAVDGSGNVFVADYGNDTVKEILAAGGYTTVHTLGSGFNGPRGVAVDGNGNVFIADTYNNAVKEILAAGGYTTVQTLGNGFSSPASVAVDGSGNIFVADHGNNAVKEIMTGGVNFGSAVIGTSTPGVIPLTFTFDTGGTIGTPAVLTQGATGLDFADAGTGDTCTAGIYAAGATCTLNVSFTPKFSGVRYGAATLTNSSGAVIATAYVYGTGLGPQVTFSPGTQSTLGSGFSFPMGMAVDGSGNVFVAAYGNNAVKEILGAGGYTTVNTLGSGFVQPGGVAVDGSGNVFVADTFNDAVKEILAAGGYTTVKTLGSGFHIPERVAVDRSGNVFVADYGNDAVKEILAADGYTTVKTLGSGFFAPAGVAVDGSGNVFVADHGNNAVKEILAAGGYTTVNTLGSGFNQPYSVAVDGSANVFVADTDNNAVKEILAAGGYTTVNTLGSGFHQPEGVAVDSSGNVFVADTFNNAVVKMDFSDPPRLSFASTAVGSTSSDSPQTVILTNIGNGALTFPVPATGFNPSVAAGFTIGNSSTCPQLASSSSAATLAPGSSCTNLISFTPTAVGSISGSLVTTDNNLNAAAPGYATQSIALSGTATTGTPTISFTVPNHTYGDAPFTVNATSTSTGAFAYTVVSGPATVAGSTVTLTGAGTVVLQASEAVDANYTASTKNATFNVATITPTIAFTVPNHIYGDAPFTVSATSNSTGAFTYTVVSGPATVSGATVTLTGAGTVVLQASEAADVNYVASTKNVTFNVATITPTIAFTVPNHIYGDAPFTVSATSNSTGAFTYTVVSGPATVSGATVTLTGAGTVVLSSSQVSSGNYAPATATTSFTVAAGFTLSSKPGTATVAPGAAATFTLTLSPGGVATYPDALTFSAIGLPTGATPTFSPATIGAGSAVTPVTLTIQTSSQTARNEKPSSGGPFAPVALGFLLLPLAGMKSVRRRMRQMPHLTVALAITVLSLGAVLGLSGCGGSSSPRATAKSYTVVVTATDVTTTAHSSINLILNVQ